MQGLVSPFRFLAISVPLFLAWKYFWSDTYLRGLTHLFVTTTGLFGQSVRVIEVSQGRIHFEYAGVAWWDSFGLTGLNLVALVALVLSTVPVHGKRRLRMLGIGIVLLVSTQVLGLWSDIVHVHLHDRPGAGGLANGIRAFWTGFGTFFFPLLIWLFLVRDLLPLRGRSQTRF